MTNPELYQFSDAFYSALNNAREQYDVSDDTQISQDEEELPQDSDTEPDEVDYEQQYNDLNDQYQQQVELNQQLQDQLSQQPSYVPSDYSDDDPNFMMDFIYKNVINSRSHPDEYSSANFRVKNSSVNISNTDAPLLSYLNTLPAELKNQILITSGNDSDVHVKGSKHYEGKALDLRYNPDLYNYIVNDPNRNKYGITTLDPNHGTAKHIHIQENY